MPVATDEPAAEEQVAEPVYCDGCGDQVATRMDDGRGPCCHNLPHPWHRGQDGLFNRISETEEAEDEDEDATPRCANCGSNTWTVSASQRITTGCEDGETIWYDHGEFEYEAMCAHCGTGNTQYELEAA